MQIKINKDGKMTIPKVFREKYNFTSGVTLRLYDNGRGMTLVPLHFCSVCGRALPEELLERGACLTCEPIPREVVFVY